MNREQALNYLHCSGMSEEQINSVVEGLTSPDAVSREAVLDALHVSGRPTKLFDYVIDVQRDIKALPPVTPKPRTRHWVEIGDEPYDTWECDNCGFVIDGSGCVDPEEYRDIFKYCPNCGAKMEIGGEDDKS